MTQKLVGMHDKFGSLYQPIPIFDIPYAAMKMIVYEAVLPPVMLGVILVFCCICNFFGRAVDNSDTLPYAMHRNTEQSANKNIDGRLFSSFLSSFNGSVCAGLGPCFYYCALHSFVFHLCFCSFSFCFFFVSVPF